MNILSQPFEPKKNEYFGTILAEKWIFLMKDVISAATVTIGKLGIFIGQT